MNYQISSDNMQMSESMKALTKQKFSKIEARLKDVPEGEKNTRVVINTAPIEKFEVRGYVTFRKNEYFSDHTDFTLESALINVVEEIARMMEKDKEKWEKWDHKVRETKHIAAEGLLQTESNTDEDRAKGDTEE